MTSLLFGQSSVGCSVHLQVDPVHPQGVQTNHNEDADEEKDPFLKTKSSQSSYKRSRMAPPQRQVGLYNRRTELKTLDATISAKFSTTANFTLFNAVRLGPDDFNVLVKKLRCIVSF